MKFRKTFLLIQLIIHSQKDVLNNTFCVDFVLNKLDVTQNMLSSTRHRDVYLRTDCVVHVGMLISSDKSLSFNNSCVLLCRSKASFKTPSEDDLGIYSCVVTHTDGVSASYTLTEEGKHQHLCFIWDFYCVYCRSFITSHVLTGLKDLLKISHEHKFPSKYSCRCALVRVHVGNVFERIRSTCCLSAVIPLKSELAVELLEKGRVRFWLQAEKMSANGKVEYVFNDNMISQGEVSGK